MVRVPLCSQSGKGTVQHVGRIGDNSHPQGVSILALPPRFDLHTGSMKHLPAENSLSSLRSISERTEMGWFWIYIDCG